MKAVFPEVYLFPAKSSRNVVLIGTKSSEHFDPERVLQKGSELIRSGRIQLPTFNNRLRSFVGTPPRAAASSPVLTDDRAPVEGLIGDGPSR